MTGNKVIAQKTECSLVKYFLKNLVVFKLRPWCTVTVLLSSNSVWHSFLCSPYYRAVNNFFLLKGHVSC